MNISKEVIDALRDLAGKLSGNVKKEIGNFNDPDEKYRNFPPLKVRKPDENMHQVPPQITGVEGKNTLDIPGNKASKNRINGDLEAGGKTPTA